MDFFNEEFIKLSKSLILATVHSKYIFYCNIFNIFKALISFDVLLIKDTNTKYCNRAKSCKNVNYSNPLLIHKSWKVFEICREDFLSPQFYLTQFINSTDSTKHTCKKSCSAKLKHHFLGILCSISKAPAAWFPL